MKPAEYQQSIQQKPRFRPELISDAQKATTDLVANFESRNEDKTGAAINRTVTEFEAVVAQIPDLFAKDKEFLLAGISAFMEDANKELIPLEERFEQSQSALEAATKALAGRKASIISDLARLNTEIKALEVKTKELKDAHAKLNAEYEGVAFGKIGFFQSRKKLTAAVRPQLSTAFDEHQSSRKDLLAKQEERRALDFNWYLEKSGATKNIETLRRDFEREQALFTKRLSEVNWRLGQWIARLNIDIEKCAQGGNLNQVDITKVDISSRANGIVTMASKEVDQFNGEFGLLAKYKSFPQQGLRPISADPGDKNQTSLEYFSENETHPDPTLFYTGQILETANNSVSRRFVSCALVEVFSPKSSRHVAFHLPPKWIKNQFGQTESANFSEYNPLFFYQKLQKFLEQENCDFADLDVKVVSGVNVAPDQIAASLKAIGCDEKKIGLYQLSADNFSTLTLADQKKILILGETIKFLAPGQQPPTEFFITGGGANGRGDFFYKTSGESRFVV